MSKKLTAGDRDAILLNLARALGGGEPYEVTEGKKALRKITEKYPDPEAWYPNKYPDM